MRSIKAGALYFILVFAAGWIIGPIRVLLIAPRIGALGAVLIEAPIMAAAAAAAARWVVRRLGVPAAFRARASMSAVALLLLLAGEFAFAAPLRGQSLGQYASGFSTPAGYVSLALFALFGAMPLLAGGRTIRPSP